ncbi:hypothetical protein ARMGADRAFT_1088430 [Armillaria gallica]|uniref:Nephrocystin 3-like N-terminal domain-containing protein n=1 Tax=Armillaria gallica TaxID=47427 RepID=A0A2H3CYY9_ARMGA|nr:hypothetical protein ARMGADRAFT_1088430 [Armillaria gallica]
MDLRIAPVLYAAHCDGAPCIQYEASVIPPLYARQMMVTDIQLQRLLSPSTTFALLPFHFSIPMDPAPLPTDIPTLIMLKDVQQAPKACSELMEELDIARAMLVEPRRQSGGQRKGSSVCIAAELQNDLGSTCFKWVLSDEKKIRALYDDLKQNSGKFSASSDLDGSLGKASAPRKCVFIVFDALDECAQSSRRESIATIRKLASAGSEISVAVTSRREQDIADVLTNVPTISLVNETQRVDGYIGRFIEDKMNNSYLPLARFRESVRVHITSTLLEKANGVFRLVDYQLHSLAKEKFENDIDEILGNLPSDLNSMFFKTLKERVSAL